MKHLAAEFKRSDDMLEVQYFGKIGTEPIQGKGLCIEADENEVILVEDNDFTILNKDRMTIDKVIPSHTNHQFTFTQIPIIALTIDSLNILLQDQWIRHINLTSEQTFRVITNGIPTEQKRYKAELLTSIWLQETEPIIQNQPQDTFIYQPNPRIPLLQQRLRQIQSERLSQQQSWRQHLQHIDNLKQLLQTTTSMTEKERLYLQLVAAQKVAPPRIDRPAEALLLTEIQQLQRAERLKNEERRLTKQQASAAADPLATLLSGFVTTVEMHEIDHIMGK